MIESREWVFRVSCLVSPGESVFVSGLCKELGAWDPEHLVLLIPEGSHDQNDQEETLWRTSIQLPPETIEFRFGVCSGIKSATGVIYTVNRWETDLHPRLIPANVSNAEEPQVLWFGYISGCKKVEKGWLIQDCALFLRLCRSNVSNDPIVLWKKKHKDKKCYLKVTPVDISKSMNVDYLDHPTDESTELTELRMKPRDLQPVIEISVLKEGETEFERQEQFGVVVTDAEYIAFQCRLPDPHTTGFLFDFYVDMMGETPKFIGTSFILPSTFKDNFGVASLPISSSKHIPIGQLTVHYMLVHPLKEHACDMRVSYARYWKESWKGLEIGHRGAGNSFHSQTKNRADIRENTIASLRHAAVSGADMVEFDVQLSKDLVPVIYHDFHACIALKHKKEPLKTDLMEIPIKDLTLAQLHKLKVYHKTEKGFSRFSDDDFDEDHQPFPALERALESVPHSCGFNVEIKWTMRLIDGTYELQHPFELNRFLDIILKVVLQSASRRKIIFSCFHPDICTMLRLKQNLYPVLFLTQAGSTRWPPYDDIRTRTLQSAILYASSANILGVNLYTEELLKATESFQMALEHSLIVFCWGDQNSDQDTIRLLKKLGLHGIIYDKIDVYNTKTHKPTTSVFLCDDNETCRCFPSPCKMVPGSPSSTPTPPSSPPSSLPHKSPPLSPASGEENEALSTSRKGDAAPAGRTPSSAAVRTPSSAAVRTPPAEPATTSFFGILSQVVEPMEHT